MLAAALNGSPAACTPSSAGMELPADWIYAMQETYETVENLENFASPTKPG